VFFPKEQIRNPVHNLPAPLWSGAVPRQTPPGAPQARVRKAPNTNMLSNASSLTCNIHPPHHKVRLLSVEGRSKHSSKKQCFRKTSPIAEKTDLTSARAV
jgi:hypothetical protein